MTYALISVYDKTGVADLARAIERAGYDIISTGSTGRLLADEGLTVTSVEEVTGSAEFLGGRVKTLHPIVHGGILANRGSEQHMAELSDRQITPIDIVVCNLYPFSQTVASGAERAECIEQIDIGGPTMIRAAAKNHDSVLVVTSPAQYPEIIEALNSGSIDATMRASMAGVAFAHTAAYDTQIASWLGADTAGSLEAALTPTRSLRYGENPHQAAELISSGSGLAAATQLGGKEMSYNNYRDTDAALRAAYDHARPTVAVIKHCNPCGIASADSIADAHLSAHACDPVSAYGGVIAANRTVTEEMARQVRPIFTEVIAAPDYTEEALEILQQKKNLRILKVDPEWDTYELVHISGGFLRQARDRYEAGDEPASWSHVAGPQADEETLADLDFAWRSVRSVRSNAILLAAGGAAVGVGMGQVNRVDSCRLAVQRANTLGEGEERARGAVAASDAFFPFADGLEELARAGVTAVVQPGGSIRDDEVIEAAKAAGISMYFTGRRHFAH
ncbi:MAG: bifunctional phosphoribosylaminoimidazolecarboxamide formyltransferase/IMP cyclohydrolase [Flaviflexus sp.]|nr:bifunctional phosphoribosylaminoimidazolecarboxamide formyltransferase/IMP cyclohydrolase [Flaviflexus sp.]